MYNPEGMILLLVFKDSDANPGGVTLEIGHSYRVAETDYGNGYEE